MSKTTTTYVMRCAIWYQSLFGVWMIIRTHAFSTFMPFLPVCISQHGVLTGLSNVNENCNENCNAMSSFTVMRHVPSNTFICSAVQCFNQFVMVYLLLTYYIVHYLVMQQVRNTVNFKNRNVQLRFEISFNDRYVKRLVNDEQQATRVKS